MWKRSDICDGKRYFLSLDQDASGRRIFTLHEVGKGVPSVDAAFLTREVPNDLLAWRNLEEISRTVATIGGERFYVDAHGVWLTQDEMNALEGDVDEDQIPWLNGLPPYFARK